MFSNALGNRVYRVFIMSRRKRKMNESIFLSFRKCVVKKICTVSALATGGLRCGVLSKDHKNL